MSLLTPLGLLGLAGIIALIVIYIIKPNYQNKVISSTYIWRLSLKYKRKSVPLSKLRNILLFLCQLIILALCALLIAQPYVPAGAVTQNGETVVVIDASANMLTKNSEGETRFSRAIDLAEEQLKKTESEEEATFSVILAGETPYYIAERLGQESLAEVYDKLDELKEEQACYYGSGDVDGAMELAEDVLTENPKAQVYFYTATTYLDKGGVNVVNVSESGEWNVAVLDCRATLSEGYYIFSVDVVSYNKDIDIVLNCDVSGANADASSYHFASSVRCEGDEVQTVEFSIANGYEGIYSYRSLRIYVDEADSFAYDNNYYLYGGEKPAIKIQYYSTKPNNFFSGVLMGLKTSFASSWDITVKEVKTSETPATEGYDLYIFEHVVPTQLPVDGVVLLIDPNSMPSSSGMTLGSQMSGSLEFSNGEAHPITANIDFTDIILASYTRVTETGDFESLLYCGGDPILLVKNTVTEKILVMPFSLNRSDLAVSLQFPLLIRNIFNYFFPVTTDDYVYEVGEDVALHARGADLTVSYGNNDLIFDEFPASIHLSEQGVYTLYQIPLSGEDVIESIYVKVPAKESNIFRTEDELAAPQIDEEGQREDQKLIVYFAAALVALRFLEWILQSRGQM